MRIFIAIEFNEQVKKGITDIKNNVREYSNHGNFTSEENFHLTMKFIGEVNENKIPHLKSALKDTTEGLTPFTIILEGLGRFVRQQRSIVWIGISEGLERLTNLHAILDDVLESYGFSKDTRSFKPHVTIGRQVDLLIPFNELKSNMRFKPITVTVNALTLIESTRVQGKLCYIPIYRCPFN